MNKVFGVNKSLTLSVLLSTVLTLSSSNDLADERQCRLLSAHRSGEHENAFQCLEALAKQGDVRAQYLVSTMYNLGHGVEKDEHNAYKWCKRAAEEGLLEAQFQLGLMYLNGEGITPDDDEAIKWLWAAADRGYPQASDVLQFIFSDDFGLGC
ncbi:MAG: sel1 repeat family protein [Candidatus Thiodiazotropha sp.]|nr:sel1 repeat family protein [Candidatus Thiodiazotropha sp.]MCM8882500.1 sel1 repeat family protein [Candidatus Thiodiazotropha sp.]MCM8921117.1 sel1 repeat family protein [Candidatus Thiodiazotropha sp.]